MENYEYRRPNVNRNASAKIKKLRKKNRNQSIWICILLFEIVALLVSFGIAYAKYYKKNFIEPSYGYISMTEEASARAYVWLNKIEDIDLSYEIVKECMGEINLEYVKRPAEVKGEYTYELSENTYEQCLNSANEGLVRAYYEAIKNRIKNSGYEGEINNELVDRLMNETFSLSVPDYINKHEIKLLPDKNEIDIKKGVSDENNQ